MKKIISVLIASFMAIVVYGQNYQLWIYSEGETSVNVIPSLVGIHESCEALTKSGFLTVVISDEEVNILLDCVNEAEEIIVENGAIGEEIYLKDFQSISMENLPYEGCSALDDRNLKLFFEILNISYQIRDEKVMAISNDNYEMLQNCIFRE